MAASNATPARWLSIVGLGESGREGLSPVANKLIDGAALLVGGARHLALVGAARCETLEWKRPFRDTIARILELRGKPVCVLASGDPFWFGAGAVLGEYVDPAEMLVLPAPSSFSLAAARLGWPLQAAVTLALHTRRVETLLRHLHAGQRILALSLDGSTPAQVAELLVRYGFGGSVLHVMEALGGPRERVHRRLAKDVIGEPFGPLNVLAIEVKAEPGARPIPFAPGLPDSYFEHDGQITKREIRSHHDFRAAARAGRIALGHRARQRLGCHRMAALPRFDARLRLRTISRASGPRGPECGIARRAVSGDPQGEGARGFAGLRKRRTRFSWAVA